MTKHTRRSVLASLGVGFGSTTIGCLTRDTDSNRPPERTSETDTGPEPTSTPGETPTAHWIERASNTPDPNLPISIDNRSDETQTVRVRVVRDATGETVHDQTHTVYAGFEKHAYNLEEAKPEGVEPFTVCGTLLGTTPKADEVTTTADATETPERQSTEPKCVTTKTSECHGDVDVLVDEVGELNVVYAVC